MIILFLLFSQLFLQTEAVQESSRFNLTNENANQMITPFKEVQEIYKRLKMQNLNQTINFREEYSRIINNQQDEQLFESRFSKKKQSQCYQDEVYVCRDCCLSNNKCGDAKQCEQALQLNILFGFLFLLVFSYLLTIYLIHFRFQEIPEKHLQMLRDQKNNQDQPLLSK